MCVSVLNKRTETIYFKEYELMQIFQIAYTVKVNETNTVKSVDKSHPRES